MSFLNWSRRVASRAGLDVQRVSATGPAHLARILEHRGVDCVLDVGASHGQYARQLRRFGFRGHIVSFEPLPDAYSSLAENAADDPRWLTYNMALGARDEMSTLNVAGNAGATSSSLLPMLRRHIQAAPDSEYVDRVEVRVCRLETLWPEIAPLGVRPFIKLDVQGFERWVLDGAAEVLPSIVGIQLEISLTPLYEGALSLHEVLERTGDLGMRMVHVEPGFHDTHTAELLQMDGVFARSVDSDGGDAEASRPSK